MLLNRGAHVQDIWPSAMSPAGRAVELAKLLARQDDVDDDDLVAWVRTNFLRGELGETTLGGQRVRSAELWWYDNCGEQEPVGLLVERGCEGGWRLLFDGRARGVTKPQVYRRIAHVMTWMGDDRWTEQTVGDVDDAIARGDAELPLGPAAMLVRAQLSLAHELRVFHPLGGMWMQL